MVAQHITDVMTACHVVSSTASADMAAPTTCFPLLGNCSIRPVLGAGVPCRLRHVLDTVPYVQLVLALAKQALTHYALHQAVSWSCRAHRRYLVAFPS